MKDKVLIIGEQGVGKSRLARNLLITNGDNYSTIVDGVASIKQLEELKKPNTIYVSNAIHGLEARLNLRDFTIIELSNI